MDNIFELFRRVATDNQDIAIETSTQSISYANLLQKSLAYYQYVLTIDSPRIAIKCHTMSINAIAMMLAIFAARKSGIFIDEKRSHTFNHKLLNALGIQSVFSQQDLMVIDNNDSKNKIANTPIDIKTVDGNHEGYVITTSGSTGEPKIILGSHAGLAHFIQWQKNRYFNQGKYRVAQITNCTFDVIYREILTTLIAGSTLVIPDLDLKYQSGETMRQWLIANRIDVLYMVPSVCDFWLSTMTSKNTKLPMAKIFFAGEKLQKTTLYQLQQHFMIDTVANFYGPSETTLAKFYYDVDVSTLEDFDSIAVGVPLPDTQVLLDDKQQVLIYTKYPSLGYLNGDTFIWREGQKFYPTGDIGEIKEGLLFIHGRLDDQVKINGVRVHLNHINEHIKRIDGVVESIVLQDNHHKLIGFYTGLITQNRVYEQLNQSLYQQIIPSVIYHLEQMPHTASGKIDRQALIRYAAQQAIMQEGATDDDFLYQAWRKTTGYQGEMTEQDNFFQLGGDSLDIAYFVIELERMTHKKIDYWSLYDYPVIQDFRQWLSYQPVKDIDDNANNDANNTSKSDIGNQLPIRTYPLTPQQIRYQKIYMPVANRNWCNMLAVWDFNRVDINTLQQSMIALIGRHDALQSYFFDKKMHIVPKELWHSYRVYHHVCDDIDFDKTLEEIRIAQATNVIDIQQWPLFSMTLIQSPNKQKIVWNIHHLICDGYSQGIIYHELKSLISSKPLPQNPPQYSDYAFNHCTGEQSSVAYWRNLYRNAYQKIEVPALYPQFGARGFQTSLPLDDNLSKQLKEFAKKYHCTPFAVMLSAYFLCIHKDYNVDDVVIGTPALGRMNKQQEQMVGNFISLVTIRSCLDDFSIHRYIKDIHHGIYQAMKYQDFQYHELLKLHHCELDQDRFPLTTFFISLLNKKSELCLIEERVIHQDLGFDVKFDMMLYIDNYQDNFVLRMQYRRALFDTDNRYQFMQKMRLKIQDMMGV